MLRNKQEKLADILLGEAVLALLRGAAPVSTTALLEQLNAMAASEKDVELKSACKFAISEIRRYLAAGRSQAVLNDSDRDTVIHVLNNDGPADGTRRH